jgi:hypothetical protein
MWEVRATDEELYAQFAGRGPVLVIAPDGTVTEQLRPIDIIEPMVPLDEAIISVLELIRDVPMAKAVRVAIAAKLDTEYEEVGTAPVRKVRAS